MKLQRRQWHPTPVLLPRKSHGWRSLVGCSPWGRWGSDTSERLHFHFSLSCIGEGNENPLQCSYLGNPRDRGAWWAAVYGVAQSRIRLKQLSSSSSRMNLKDIMLSKISQAQKTNTTWSHLWAESKIVKLIEAESRMVVAKDWGEKGTLLHCWWEWKLVQPLWRTVWGSLKTKSRMAIWLSICPLLSIWPVKSIIQMLHEPQCLFQLCLQ